MVYRPTRIFPMTPLKTTWTGESPKLRARLGPRYRRMWVNNCRKIWGTCVLEGGIFRKAPSQIQPHFQPESWVDKNNFALCRWDFFRFALRSRTHFHMECRLLLHGSDALLLPSTDLESIFCSVDVQASSSRFTGSWWGLVINNFTTFLMVVQKHSCTSSLADAASATCLPTPSLTWWQGECHRCDLEENRWLMA